MKAKVIAMAAPEAPRCFSSRNQWVQYLVSAQRHPKPERRPFVTDEYRAGFCFCRDCPATHRADMEDRGRCDFEGYVAQVNASKEASSVAASV